MIKTGQVVTGTITGIKPYGAFVSLEDNYSGLIHISEISDGFVKDVENFVHINEPITVKVLDIDEDHHQCKLSLKALNSGIRKANKRKKMEYLPPNVIGFQSIADSLDQWVEEAKSKQGNEK